MSRVSLGRWFRRCLILISIQFLYTPLCLAESIGLDSVLLQAVANSYDLKIADTDVRISQAGVKIARSDYFPTIKSQSNVEYFKDPSDNVSTVTSIGNTVLPAGTRFQNSVGLSLNHTLLDFGVRKRRLQIAKKEVLAKQAAVDQTLRELKLKIISVYSEALMNAKTLQAKKEVLALYQGLYQMKQRLYTAGKLNRVEVSEEAIQIAQTLDEIHTLKERLQKDLDDLSYFTQEKYQAETLELSDIEDEQIHLVTTLKEEYTPESRIFQSQIEQKQKEIELLKRQYLPQLNLYSNYNLYGFNRNNFVKSIKDLDSRAISFGVTMSMPIFDGMKTAANIEKAKYELEKIKLQKEQKLTELRHRYQTEEQAVNAFAVELTTKAEIVTKSEDKLSMMDQLTKHQLMDKTVLLKEKVQKINHEAELEQSNIKRRAAMRRLKILSES